MTSLKRHRQSDLFVSIISFHEQAAGWQAYLNRAKTPAATVRAYSMFQRILADFASAQLLPFDKSASQKFEELRSAGVRIGTLDLRISAIALSRNFVVLSRNLVDFAKVPGLLVEDWTM
jgi:tRNA(fMet)-specific endonuclease VapC